MNSKWELLEQQFDDIRDREGISTLCGYRSYLSAFRSPQGINTRQVILGKSMAVQWESLPPGIILEFYGAVRMCNRGVRQTRRAAVDEVHDDIEAKDVELKKFEIVIGIYA